MDSVQTWQGHHRNHKGPARPWAPSGLNNLIYEEPAPSHTDPFHTTRWTLTELLTNEQLAIEGHTMHHCVGTYGARCRARLASIWSLRRRTPTGGWRSVLTVEVDVGEKTVVEALGRCNTRAKPRALRVVRAWARSEGLKVRLRR